MKTLPLGIAAAVLTAGVAFAQTNTAPSTTPGGPASNTPGATTMPPSTTPATTMPGSTMPGSTPSGNASGSSRAQLNPGNNNSPTTPAVTTSQSPSKTSAAPVKGANSFSMGEARNRITAGGFTQVSGLRKDRNGIWRGKAMKDGQSVNVYCDYQGNVGAQ